jgi:hypothetical protein
MHMLTQHAIFRSMAKSGLVVLAALVLTNCGGPGFTAGGAGGTGEAGASTSIGGGAGGAAAGTNSGHGSAGGTGATGGQHSGGAAGAAGVMGVGGTTSSSGAAGVMGVGGTTSSSGAAGVMGVGGDGLARNENGGLLCLKDWRSSAACNASSCLNNTQGNCALALDCCASGPASGYAPCTRSNIIGCASPAPSGSFEVLDCLCK